eukprot:g1634.t1
MDGGDSSKSVARAPPVYTLSFGDGAAVSAEQRAEMRKLRLEEELRQQERAELTFAPRINADFPLTKERPADFLVGVEADALQREQRQRELVNKAAADEIQFNRPSPQMNERSQAYIEKWEQTNDVGGIAAHEKVFSTAGYWKRRAERIEERSKRHSEKEEQESSATLGEATATASQRTSDKITADDAGDSSPLMMTVEESLYKDAEERRTRLQAVQDAVAQQERLVREASKMNPRSVGLAARKHERHLQVSEQIRLFSDMTSILHPSWLI